MPAPKDADATSRTVTRLLNQWSAGDASVEGQLWDLVKDDIYRIAKQRINEMRRGSSLEATAMMGELYTRLKGETRYSWEHRRQFYGMVAKVIRNMLIDEARSRGRSPILDAPVEFKDLPGSESSHDAPQRILSLDVALEELAEADPELARVVELRVYGGFPMKEIAETLNVSERTADRRWRYARAWLKRAVEESESR